MSFSNRLNTLFGELGCSNSDIAKLAGIHPSGISRFRNGKRIPTPRNNQVQRMCAGIIAYSNSVNKNDIIYSLCKITESNSEQELSEQELIDQLILWLLKDSLNYKIRRHSDESSYINERSFKYFSDKLNIIMSELGISNNSMADGIHVDASVISRFRNHVRVPSSDIMLNAISTYLYDVAIKNNQLSVLTSVSNMPNSVRDDRKQSVQYISDWFSGSSENVNHKVIGSFLDIIDKFTPEAFPPLPDLALIAPEQVRNAKTECYLGIGGLREAVVRFLGNAAVSNSSNSLLLYSDQSMDWMTGDPEYRKIWAALMVYTLRAKNRIRIIHNIERSTTEMVHAIEGWLPLYMTGLLEAYINKKSAGERFAHTMFISKDKEAVVANFPSGMEDEGEYNYITDERVKYYVQQHDTLTASSIPIMRMFSPNDSEGLILQKRKLAEGNGELCKLLSSLSIGTMSEATLSKILNHQDIRRDTRKKIEEYHQTMRELNAKALNSGLVTEYICIKDGFEPNKLSLSLEDLFFNETLYYNEEDYENHLNDMRKLHNNSSNYSFRIIDENFFDNLQIIVKKDSGALVVKTRDTHALPSYWHSIMANVYFSYIKELVSGKIKDVRGWK